jgi:hypothetical protein
MHIVCLVVDRIGMSVTEVIKMNDVDVLVLMGIIAILLLGVPIALWTIELLYSSS